jgi:hypothetical protein
MKETCQRTLNDDGPPHKCGEPAVMRVSGLFYCLYHGEYQQRVEEAIKYNEEKRKGHGKN